MPQPSYHDLGDHTEALQVDYDPARITYAELLEVFWGAHNPTSPSRSAQYKAVVFYHDEDQGRQALETATRLECALGKPITTEIMPRAFFTRAEDYHQKHRLRRHPPWLARLEAIYPEADALTDSTAAARLNAAVAGFGEATELLAELELGPA